MKNDKGSKNHRVLGIGTPIVDFLIDIPFDYLATLPGAAGGSALVSYEALQKIFNETGSPLKIIAGGSAANTIKGLSELDYASSLIGTVGNDAAGKIFSEGLASRGITPLLSIGTLPTAQVACLITPDRDRTMRAYIGAGAEMSPENVLATLFEGVRLVHIEGYLINRPGVIEKTMQLAKKAGSLISFDLSSFEIVKAYKDSMLTLLSRYVDILFANEEEAFALVELPPEKACLRLKDFCPTVVVKMGKKGSLGAADKILAFHQALDVPVVDTTGAGDLFASGFLHGILSGNSLEESLYYGSLTASYVIQNLGAEIPSADWISIKRRFLPLSDL